MAVKQKNTQETPAVEAQSADTGNGGSSAKKERKPRTPSGFVWSRPLQAALSEILRRPKAPGDIRTAGSVAAALVKEGYTNVTAQRVKSFIESTRMSMQAGHDSGEIDPKTGERYPAPADWFELDATRVKADPSLFS